MIYKRRHKKFWRAGKKLRGLRGGKFLPASRKQNYETILLQSASGFCSKKDSDIVQQTPPFNIYYTPNTLLGYDCGLPVLFLYAPRKNNFSVPLKKPANPRLQKSSLLKTLLVLDIF